MGKINSRIERSVAYIYIVYIYIHTHMYTNIFTYFHKNKSLEKSQYHKKDIGEHLNDKMK